MSEINWDFETWFQVLLFTRRRCRIHTIDTIVDEHLILLIYSFCFPHRNLFLYRLSKVAKGSVVIIAWSVKSINYSTMVVIFLLFQHRPFSQFSVLTSCWHCGIPDMKPPDFHSPIYVKCIDSQMILLNRTHRYLYISLRRVHRNWSCFTVAIEISEVRPQFTPASHVTSPTMKAAPEWVGEPNVRRHRPNTWSNESEAN